MIRSLFYKLAPYKSFHKFVLLQVVGLFLLFFIASRFSSLAVQGAELPLGDLFTLPAAWRTSVALSRFLFWIPAVFLIQLICAELELKIVRAQIIAGLERYQLVLGWVVLGFVLSIIGVVATILCVGALAHGSGYKGMIDSCTSLAVYGFSFMCWAVLAATLMQKPVPSIVLLFMGPTIIESMAHYALGYYDFPAAQAHLPFAVLAELVAWPNLAVGATLSLPTVFEALAFGVVAAIGAAWRLHKMDL